MPIPIGTNLTFPTVHMNGTSRSMLQEGYREARLKVREAVAAFEAIEFNARDYYVQGPEAWTKARDERTEQFKKLKSVEEYTLLHLIALKDDSV